MTAIGHFVVLIDGRSVIIDSFENQNSDRCRKDERLKLFIVTQSYCPICPLVTFYVMTITKHFFSQNLVAVHRRIELGGSVGTQQTSFGQC